jgi:HEAT repeat protein
MLPAHRTVLAYTLSLCIAAPLFAHNGEVRPKPGPPMAPSAPVNQGFGTIKPPRWSWVHWWEANRDRFLKPENAQKAEAPTTEPIAATQQSPATQESDPLRLQAVRLLLDVIDRSDNEELVEQATLAIGKIQYRTAIPLLGAEAQKSRSQRVRRAALVALGLIGGPEAELQILAFNPQTVDDRLAALTALGLLPTIQDATLQNLRNALMSAPAQAGAPQQRSGMNGIVQRAPVAVADAQTATTLCWALRQHHVPDNLHFYQNVVWTNESPWVSSEAITALGEAPDATPALAKILLAKNNAINDVAAWNLLDLINRQKAAILNSRVGKGNPQQRYDKSYQEYEKQYAEYQKKNPNAPPAKAKQQVRSAPPVFFGEEQIFISNLRSSAAVALGHTQRDDARDALMQLLEPSQDEFQLVIRGFAVMALTQYPNDETRDRLIFLLGKTDPLGKLVIQGTGDFPTRGFAALALGVMKSSAVVPILTQAWHLNYWVNREVIISLKLVGATGTARPILDRLRESKDPKEQAYMAQALGELLAKEQPTRLTRLMAETNFTVRNDPVEPLKELANEFLFAYLIPCFGDTWR